jgi:hypothetical protein
MCALPQQLKSAKLRASARIDPRRRLNDFSRCIRGALRVPRERLLIGAKPLFSALRVSLFGPTKGA